MIPNEHIHTLFTLHFKKGWSRNKQKVRLSLACHVHYITALKKDKANLINYIKEYKSERNLDKLNASPTPRHMLWNSTRHMFRKWTRHVFWNSTRHKFRKSPRHVFWNSARHIVTCSKIQQGMCSEISPGTCFEIQRGTYFEIQQGMILSLVLVGATFRPPDVLLCIR